MGEPIYVSGTAVNSGDWIGIYRVNQAACILWDNVSTYGNGVTFNLLDTQVGGDKSTGGTVPEGRYVIRLVKNGSSDLGQTACHTVITVGNPGVVEGDSSLLSVEKNKYLPGEKVNVSGIISNNSKDWIGIYALNSHNSVYNNMWKYISNVGEGVSFDLTAGGTLPLGDYVVCHIENDMTKPPNATAWAVISVVEKIEEGGSGETDGTDEDTSIEEGSVGEIRGDQTVMSLEKFSFKKGEPIMVSAQGDGNDWVGIYSSLSQYNATKWHYVTSAISGVAQDITQGTELESGNYYIRYVKDSENKDDTVAMPI